MSKSISVTQGLPEHAAALTDLCLRSKRSNGYDDAFMAACRDELTVTAEQLATQQWWVAVDGLTSALCGCVGLIPADLPNTGEIHAFFIDPPYQRQGVGKLLWHAVSTQAIKQGFTRLILYADPNAVPFYQAIGFSVIGEAPSGSIPGRMLPKMATDLRST